MFTYKYITYSKHAVKIMYYHWLGNVWKCVLWSLHRVRLWGHWRGRAMTCAQYLGKCKQPILGTSPAKKPLCPMFLAILYATCCQSPLLIDIGGGKWNNPNTGRVMCPNFEKNHDVSWWRRGTLPKALPSPALRSSPSNPSLEPWHGKVGPNAWFQRWLLPRI